MPATMRRIARHEYGPPDTLRLEETLRPEPGHNEVLVRVRATTVNYGDLLARDFRAVGASKFNMPYPLLLLSKLYFGPRRPRQPVLGSEYSGLVEVGGAERGRLRIRRSGPGFTRDRPWARTRSICG